MIDDARATCAYSVLCHIVDHCVGERVMPGWLLVPVASVLEHVYYGVCPVETGASMLWVRVSRIVRVLSVLVRTWSVRVVSVGCGWAGFQSRGLCPRITLWFMARSARVTATYCGRV